MRGIRFEVEATPELLEGSPPAFVERALACLAPWRPTWIAYDFMTFTARAHRGWLFGFQVDVNRVPGTTRLRVFVEPWCRLASFLLLAELVAFLAVGGLAFLVGLFRGSVSPGTFYFAFAAAMALWVPVHFVLRGFLDVWNQITKEQLEEIAAAVRAALGRGYP